MKLNIDDISQDSTFTINKYLFYQVDQESAVIQTANGITKISDKRMIELTRNWEESFVESISYLDLEFCFSDDTQEAIEYLMHYGIIELTKKKYNPD